MDAGVCLLSDSRVSRTRKDSALRQNGRRGSEGDAVRPAATVLYSTRTVRLAEAEWQEGWK
jgi:hypothetical protein